MDKKDHIPALVSELKSGRIPFKELFAVFGSEVKEMLERKFSAAQIRTWIEKQIGLEIDPNKFKVGLSKNKKKILGQTQAKMKDEKKENILSSQKAEAQKEKLKENFELHKPKKDSGYESPFGKQFK